MNTYRKIRMWVFVILALAAMVWVSSCASIDEGIRFQSSTGCCAYVVYEDDCLQYEEDGYHTTICWDDKQNKEQTIEELHEYCYDNHYQNQ